MLKNKAKVESLSNLHSLWREFYCHGGFIKELEENNFVAIQTITSDKEREKDTILYDRDKYMYDSESNRFTFLIEKVSDLIEIPDMEIPDIENYYNDFVDLLDKYAYKKIIYPLPLLKDYVENNFKTIEQRQFDKQICRTNLSIKVAIAAVIISAVAPFLVVKCSDPTKLDPSQIEKIEKAIINNNTEVRKRTEIFLSDTLNQHSVDISN